MGKATNLSEAIHRFSPLPIEFGVGSTNESFYATRPDDPLDDLRVHLLSSHSSDKILLAGHRGTGKSTELNRLAASDNITERYKVVRFSVKDSLELSDIDHVDLLFTMLAKIYECVSEDDLHLEFQKTTLDALEGWRSQVLERTREDIKNAGIDAGTGIDSKGLLGFFGRFGLRLRYERSTREVARQVVQPRISEFLTNVSAFLRDVQASIDQETGRRLLLLIEDLDKIPEISRSEKLFYDNGPYLADLPACIVYTVPIALHYSKKFPQIANRFGQSILIPNVRLVSHEDGRKPYEAGIQTMQSFVHQRMNASLIDADALASAISLGGGLFQQTQRLLQKACIKAVARNAARITEIEIREAAADMRAELERGLARDDIRILHEVNNTKQASADEASLNLLHFLHLVEYRNCERWCDVNPLLLPTLERWKPESPT